MRYPPYRGTAANRFWVCGATALLVIGSAGALAFQMDTDERRRFCGNDDTRCWEMDYYDVSSCFFIYSKRPAWFGLIDRWYVYSERGGPTLPLRKFKELVYVDWMDAVRFSAFRSNLLNEIGARELGNCDVDYFWRIGSRGAQVPRSCANLGNPENSAAQTPRISLRQGALMSHAFLPILRGMVWPAAPTYFSGTTSNRTGVW